MRVRGWYFSHPHTWILYDNEASSTNSPLTPGSSQDISLGSQVAAHKNPSGTGSPLRPILKSGTVTKMMHGKIIHHYSPSCDLGSTALSAAIPSSRGFRLYSLVSQIRSTVLNSILHTIFTIRSTKVTTNSYARFSLA